MKKSENNIPKKGMSRHTHPAELSNQEYSFALNANIQDERGDGDLILLNEPSNIKCSGFKDGYVVIKHKYDRVRNKTYFFLVNEETGCSEIGWIDMTYVFEGNEPLEQTCKCNISVVLEDGLENIIQESTCEYNTLISDYCELTSTCTGCLGFSIDQPITDVVIRHSQRGDEIYFTDGVNPQRYLKTDEIDSYFQEVDDCTGEITPTCLDCDKLRIFNLYDFPCLKVDTIQNGGSLKAGVYEVVIAYSDVNGNELSDYLSLTNPIAIFDANNTVLDQTSLDYKTSQAFSIEISGLDLDYDYYRVVIISRTGNDPAPIYTTYAVLPTSETKIVVTSLPTIRQEIKEVNERDILNRRPLYLTAKGLADVNGYLFQHTLEAQRTINLQPVVSLMGAFVKWGTVEALEKIYKRGENMALYRGYMRDEVYPLSIQFKKKGGYRLPNFVFIPRPPRDEEIDTINPSDLNYLSVTEAIPDCAEVGRDKVWQFKNTATSEEIACANANPQGEIEREETYDCQSETEITIGASNFPYFFEGSIAQYILDNRDLILAGTEPELEDLREALEDFEEYENCTPPVSENCTDATLVSEQIIVVATEGEELETVEEDPESYPDVLPPSSCANFAEPPAMNTGVESALPPGSTVVQKTTPGNTTCITAVEIADLITGTPNAPYFLDDKYEIGGNSSLLTSFDVSVTSDVFKNKLHSNAIFFKVSSFPSDKVSVNISNSLCTSSDDNTNNSIRVTVFEGCPTLVEKVGYGSIISDISVATITERFITLEATDFPSGVAYIVIDSPMRSDYEVDVTFTGTSGTAEIEIGTETYLATFNTDLTTTASDFYTTHLADLTAQGILATLVGSTVNLRMSKILYDSIDLTPLTGDLAIVVTDVENYHTLQPPCGCIALYKRTTKTKDVVSFDSITLSKIQTYTYTCTYSQSIVTECDPAPYNQGLFSYWESSFKYPCNQELYDSSQLNIRTVDIPNNIRDIFESYYVDSISGIDYVLNSETNFMDKPIRHYKFPDNIVSPFMRTQDASQNSNPESIVYPIGFVIDNEVINAFLDIAVKNSLITEEERADITGYELFRGDRATERSIIAKGLIYNTLSYPDLSREGKITHYPNYPLNDLHADALNGFTVQAIANRMFTFHSPETHFDKPTIPFELGLEGYQLGYSANHFAPLKDHPKYVILGRRARQLATTLSIIESTAEILILTSDLIVNASSGINPAAGAIAITAGIGLAATLPFKIGRYRYEWLNTMEQLGNGYNHAYTAVAVGNYHDFVVNGEDQSTLRGLKIATYLNSGNKEVREEGLGGQTLFVNNFQRETSVLVKTDDDYPLIYDPTLIGYDTSRTNIPLASVGRIYTQRRAMSPYVSLKQFIPNQWNALNSIQWLHTGYCGNLEKDNTCEVVFGGDIFISRMTLKRKFPFFTENAWKLSADVPFKYSTYFNVNNNSNNRGFIDFKTKDDTFSAAGYVFPEVPSRFSLWDGSSFITENNNGEFYMNDKYKFLVYYYGIPNFLVESEINLNYRYARLEAHEDFYPNVGDPSEWTQQSTVTITHDNEYNYNRVYSARPHKWAYQLLPVNYNKAEWDKLDDLMNAVIYSQQDDVSSALRSPWLNYKSLDLHNFNKSFGELIDIKGIESDQLWARFTDGMIVLGAIDSLKDRLTESQRTIGIGGIFNERNINFNKTELGHAGTQHKISISTEFGHYWVDAKRGKVYEMKPNAQGLTEISQSLDKWFKEQLPFKILKAYPQVNVDNVYGGIGISMGWDDRLKRLFVTKLDYIPKVNTLSYTEDTGFYDGEPTCPEGYELIDGVCTLVETAPKIQTGEAYPTVSAGNVAHGFQEPVLYSDYNADGSGVVDGLSPTGYTWQRLSAPFWTGNGITSNRITSILGRWIAGSWDINTWYGGTAVVNIEESKTYYVLLAADNEFRFRVDGLTVVESDPLTIGAQLTANPANYTAQTFRQVHIYPIQLRRGCRFISVEGLDYGVSAMFAGAILDNTENEIINATSLSDLNFVYSTADIENFYDGETITFSCPDGYTPIGDDVCDECERILTEPLDYNLVSVLDEEYFEKAYWTVGYSPLTKSWISYYSFYPNYYNSYNEYFQTGINGEGEGSIWTHHPFISSYQVFYGQLYPFIVEFAAKTNGMNSYMERVNFYLDVRKYYNMYDFSDTFGKGFNKAYIYNNFQNTGLLKLKFQEKSNQRQLLQYPKYSSDSIEVLQSEMEGRWSFNFLYNSLKNERQGLPIWINDNVQVLKEINPTTVDYRAIRRDRIRGDYFLIRLIQDEDSRNKMLFRLTEIIRDYNA